MDAPTLLWTLYLLAIAYCVALMIWANRMAALYRRLRRARAVAETTRDWQTWAVVSIAMVDVHQDLCRHWRRFFPLFWIRTLLRDYTEEVRWALNEL